MKLQILLLLMIIGAFLGGMLYFIDSEGIYDVEGTIRAYGSMIPGAEKYFGSTKKLPQSEISELEAIQEENAREDRWEALKKTEGELKTAESTINSERQRLAQWEGELERREKAIKDRETEFNSREKTYERAVKYYITMKPVDAAKILSQQEDILVMEIFRRMNERNVAAIMAEMDPAVAGAIMRKMSR